MAPPPLQVEDITCRRGGREVFNGLFFNLYAGDLLTVIGRNGSGKTTLLRALALLVPVTAGTIRWQGLDVRTDSESWRGQLAWLGHLDGLKGDLTVWENLALPERLRRGVVDWDRLGAAADAFDIGALATRPVRTLSAGQRRRTALTRVTMSPASIWLLDEPLNALDEPAQDAFRVALTTHLASGGLAVAATHVNLGVSGERRLLLS